MTEDMIEDITEEHGWCDIGVLPSKSYTCGHCGKSIASDIGYRGTFTVVIPNTLYPPPPSDVYIYICPHCGRPTFINTAGEQIPGGLPGELVEGVDDADVAQIYDEARRAFSRDAFTAVVLCCRKLLMHIAVSKGAPKGGSFKECVDYLDDNNHIPQDSKEWVDHIREKGNEANHEIKIVSKDEAEEVLIFVSMLLKLVYEFPSKMKHKNTQSASGS